MIKYTEYKYHLAALFSVAVWGATFVSTKVLIAPVRQAVVGIGMA